MTKFNEKNYPRPQHNSNKYLDNGGIILSPADKLSEENLSEIYKPEKSIEEGTYDKP